MKFLTVTIPEGYEIDKEASTFEYIVFKEIKKQLPKSWEELEHALGYYTDSASNIMKYCGAPAIPNKNIFATEEQAEASIALAQLSQLREVYRQGWEPDWTDSSIKYCITRYKDNTLARDAYTSNHHFLAFQSVEVRDEFFVNFKDLIEQASPLLFD